MSKQSPTHPDDRSHLLLLAELLVFSLGLAGCLTMQLDRTQPAAYMDEIFHVPMAQKYCRGVFTDWDPKITTPPGLYALSSGLLRLVAMATNSTPADATGDWAETVCSVFRLRLTNLAYFLISFLSLYGILSSPRHYDAPSDMPEPRTRVLKAFCLSLLPVSFFFVSLFYTDQASVACLLAAYFMQLNQHRLLAGLLGCLAVACRQTNAVWLLFFLAVELDRAWQARLRGFAKRLEDADSDAVGVAAPSEPSLWSEASAVLRHPVQFLFTGCRVAAQSWPLVAALAGFAVFVRLNNGVALGDKAAHTARLHGPQLLYFLAFAVVMHPAAVARSLWLAVRAPNSAKAHWLWRMALPLLALCGLAFAAVRFQTYEHPYLLADNRHLTFYVWQRVFQRHWSARYLLVPAYAAALLVYWGAAPRSALLRLALLGCSALALVPAALIEPRYFIAPWLLWRLSASRHDTRRRLLAESAYFACVNGAAFWLFLRRPFSWPGVPGVQRFVW